MEICSQQKIKFLKEKKIIKKIFVYKKNNKFVSNIEIEVN